MRVAEARARSSTGDLDGAKLAAEKAAELAADNPEPWMILAGIAAKRQGSEAARALTAKALAIAPTWAAAHFVHGIYLNDVGRTHEAAIHVQRATELDPDYADAWYNLACYRALLGETQAALVALAEAVARDPSSRETAREDADFASIATDPRFVQLTT
jgi:predicted Zn-dependent protease